jgi:hypothetical protein
MREFFRGWKRKLGVVTLGLACVFAAGWVRSFRTEDSFFYQIGPYVTDSLFSISGSVGWRRDDDSVCDIVPARENFGFQSRRSVGRQFLMYSEVERWHWKWRWCGLGRAWGAANSGGDAEILILPYWSIILPLTLLSACLLLSKPRPGERTTP